MKDLRIVFFGTPVFACSVLQALIDEGYTVAAAVSQPDRPVGRKRRIEPTPVHALADRYGIPVIQPVKLKDEMDAVLAYEPDLIVTCAYGQFVPSRILQAPKYGCVNIHPSLLPKYRGGAPVHRAVMNDDRETGVCLMEMVKEMDAGRVYVCRKTEIGPDMTTAELNTVLEKISADIIREDLPEYLKGNLPGTPQDPAGVVLAPNISREEEQVHFSTEEIRMLYAHVRALIDEPYSYGVIEGKRVKFCAAAMEETETPEAPGTVLGFADHAMRIAAKGGVLCVKELQMEGKGRMNADAFANGAGRALTGKVFD